MTNLEKITINSGYIKEIPNPTIEEIKLAININADNIQYIKNPSDELCKIAIDRSHYSFHKITNPSYEVCLYAVTKKGYLLANVELPQTEEIINIALRQSTNFAQYIKFNKYIDINNLNLDKEGYLHVISYYKYLKVQPYEINMYLVQFSQHALANIRPENRTNDIIMQSLKRYPASIRTLKASEQTDEMHAMVIRRNPEFFRHLKNPSEDICWHIVYRHPEYIKFMKNPSASVINRALGRYGQCLRYVKNQTEEQCLIAVKNDGIALLHVNKQTINIVKAALENNPVASKYVKTLDVNFDLLDNL